MPLTHLPLTHHPTSQTSLTYQITTSPPTTIPSTHLLCLLDNHPTTFVAWICWLLWYLIIILSKQSPFYGPRESDRRTTENYYIIFPGKRNNMNSKGVVGLFGGMCEGGGRRFWLHISLDDLKQVLRGDNYHIRWTDKIICRDPYKLLEK